MSGEPAVLVNADVDEMHVHNYNVGVCGTEITHLRVGFVGLREFTNIVVVVAEIIVSHLGEKLLDNELVPVRRNSIP